MAEPSWDPAVYCPACSARNRPGANFCDNCGAALRKICANCGQPNRPGARFCDNCGAPFTGEAGRPAQDPGAFNAVPREVGQAEAPQAAQAGEDTPLAVRPAAPQRAGPVLQRYISADFAGRLENARAAGTMLGERRVVTILFCDVVGSTAAAGQMDPEAWTEIIQGIFERMIRPVYQYEGIVARLMGDAILAFFGAPITHEDDPQRAILAGLDIIQAIAPYRDEMRRKWDLDINVRVGINTGLVVVGPVGTDLQMEYTAMGDAINVAARMEQTAEPGTVQISEDTHRLVAPLFEFEDLGEMTIKGKTGQVRTYRPLRLQKQPAPLRGIQGMRSPLVGREEELGQFRHALADLRSGVGRVVFLLGEAGLGKSRMVRELKEPGTGGDAGSAEKSAAALIWVEVASPSYEAHKPYGLFQLLYQRVWAAAPIRVESVGKDMPVRGDTPDGKDMPGGEDTPGGEGKSIPAEQAQEEGDGQQGILAFLSGQQIGLEIQDIEGEAFKRQLFETISTLLGAMVDGRPTVLVFDDLHWADPASVELLEYLFPLTAEKPLLLLCVMRPDRDSPAWQARQSFEEAQPHRFLEVQLKPLNTQESDRLVNQLLNISGLPDPIHQQILEKTEGNPFFIEEVIHTLIDRGAVRPAQEGPGPLRWELGEIDIQEIEIPNSLLSVLAARIDRLEEGTRRVLQTAAVIGRSFHYRVLRAVNAATLPAAQGSLPGSRAEARLEESIQALLRADFLREAARLPEPEYVFRHALTQEAAYHTLTLKQRRELHQKAGEAIETLFSGSLENFYPLLAHHFGQAGDSRAFEYELLSGDAAYRVYAITGALAHYERALASARQRENLSPEAWKHLYTRRGRSLELLSRHTQALANYREMEALAARLGDPGLEMAALLAAATILAVPTPVRDAEQARSSAERGLALARRLGDAAAEARALWTMMLSYNYSGHMAKGVPFGEQSIALSREHHLNEQLAYSLQDISLAYAGLGRLAEAVQSLKEAGELCLILGNQPLLAENYTDLSFAAVMFGNLAEAIALSEKGCEIARQIGNEWGLANTRLYLSLVYITTGEIDQALDLLNMLMPLAEKVGHPGVSMLATQKGILLMQMGEWDLACEILTQTSSQAIHFPAFYSYPLAVLAQIHISAGRLEEAKAALDEIRRVGIVQMLYFFDRAFEFAQIQYLEATGAAEEALELSIHCIQREQESGSRYSLPGLLHLQGHILSELGRVEEAAAALERARQAGEEMNDRIELWKIYTDLSSHCQRRGDAASVRRYQQAANELVDWIAAHIRSAAMRQSFLNLAEAHHARASAPVETGSTMQEDIL